jgi:hypothetical protein
MKRLLCILTLQERLQNAAKLMQQAKCIVGLTRAGISTESGIPDFADPALSGSSNHP